MKVSRETKTLKEPEIEPEAEERTQRENAQNPREEAGEQGDPGTAGPGGRRGRRGLLPALSRDPLALRLTWSVISATWEGVTRLTVLLQPGPWPSTEASIDLEHTYLDLNRIVLVEVDWCDPRSVKALCHT